MRVLFAAAGWPSGVLEIGSWAKHEGLADPVIVQLHPGCASGLEPEDRLEVTVRENLENEGVMAAISGFVKNRPPRENLFGEDGSLAPAAREALMAVGGRFIKRLIEFDPHVIGFRLEGGQLDQLKTCIEAVRLFSNAEIVLGGPTATSHPREVLEDTGADYVFTGEAEESFNLFLRLARKHNSKDRQAEIPGLAYRYGGRVWLNTLPADGYGRLQGKKARADLEHHDALRSVHNLIRPTASTELIAANRLDWSLLHDFDQSRFDSLFFTGGRGCPGSCTFCAKMHGQEVRFKPAGQLLEEIETADACVAAGKMGVTRWKLFKHVDDPALRDKEVVWAAVYDEDFFLNRKRAVEFFELWHGSPLKERYRLSFQTNPRSLLASDGRPHAASMEWIDRAKPMVQLGAESFNPELLARWHKRHNLQQLQVVLDALDRTGQDYTVFQLLTDFDSTAEELVESLRLLITNAYRHRRMRIASSPFTIPLYDSDTRRLLEYGGKLSARWVRHFTDYEHPQPGWMDVLAAELADLADAELRWALEPEQRDAALFAAFEAVLERIRDEEHRVRHSRATSYRQKQRIRRLHDQVQLAMDEIKDSRFRGIAPADE